MASLVPTVAPTFLPTNSTGDSVRRDVTFGFGLSLSLGLLACTLALLLRSLRGTRFRDLLVVNLFCVLTLITLFFRFLWWIFVWQKVDENADFVFNRIALCAYVTAFTLVAGVWVAAIHANAVPKDGEFLPRVKWVFLLGNVGLYLFQLSMIIAYFTTAKGEREDNVTYDVNILVLAAVMLLVALAFIVYGLLILKQINKLPRTGEALRRTRALTVSVLMAMVVFSACFILRFAMFLYRPVTDKFLSTPLFYCCAYMIPEVIPIGLQLFMLNRKLGDMKKAAQGVHPSATTSRTAAAGYSTAADSKTEPLNKEGAYPDSTGEPLMEDFDDG